MSANTQNGVFEIDVLQWLNSSGIDNPATHVSEPVEITCYSRNGHRDITYGSRKELHKFSEPELQVNLGQGFGSFVPKVTGDVGVEPILTALLKAAFDVDGQADVITYRNNLNKIGLAPYENRDGWELDCTLVGRTVFLDIRQKEDSADSAQQLFMYYGYRFESLCTDASEDVVNANAEFCSISRLRLANHRILLCSEIDCTSNVETSGNPLKEYVELKTMKVIENDRALASMYRHRFLKYWLQSYLAGVRKICLGLRTDDGQLVSTKWLRTSGIPREARQHFDQTRARSRWDPFVAINFLDYTLATIREACTAQPGSTIRVSFNPATKTIKGALVGSPGEGLSARVAQVREQFRSCQNVPSANFVDGRG